MAFSYAFTPRARQSVVDAQNYLAQFGPDAPLRFANALQTALSDVCDETRPRQVLDETGSLAFSQPVYLRLFTTTKARKRGSSAGVWRLYYTLKDANADGQADTVLVLLVSHAAAQPLTAWMDEPGDGETNE